ncbi:strawberry notch C-terminal domain-containing protein [Castellaniella sp.]|uniref:strawberry notch C-terminal domain-containing protein n=1 Tax=Castellaniella sp. TaxID=1955812 RepID=UPI002AFFDF3B|nr:strawberry notch C-terminal domain-containing protein [Castellaniella sp.]
MMVVGARRAAPVQTAVPEKLAILTSYDELWQWGEGLVKGYAVAQVQPPIAPEDEVIAVSGLLQAPVFGEGGVARIFRGESTLADVDEGAHREQAEQEAERPSREPGQPVEPEEVARPETQPSGDETPRTEEAVTARGEPTAVPGDQPHEERAQEQEQEQRHGQQQERQQASETPAQTGTLAAWQMSREQWEQALALGEGAQVADLRFGVMQWARDKLAAHESGEEVLAEGDLAEVIERINSPVSHRDVIEKALAEGLSVPAAVLAEYPDIEFADERKVNEFQAPYQPASRLGEPSTMIPINMAGATYAALNALEARVGPVDEYVASKLQYRLEDLGSYFSPEQIDALGLGISAVEQGRGIINADMTGVGKGRYVAGLIRYAKLHDLKPIFLTIKPELFTDIFRDIGDIGSADLFKNLFIFNDGVNVKKFGTESEVLYRATTPGERATALASGAVEDDVDLVLATYSQFQRAYAKNRKAQLLTELAANGGMLVLDEAHVAAGSSNLGETVQQAVANSHATMYASATPLKGVENFGLYCKVFPASVDLKSLPDTLRTGGEALQEAISANMARDGVLIRRELDFSDLVFHTRNPAPEREVRNRELADKLADIVSQLGYLAGDVAKMVSSMNKEYKKAWEEVPEQDRRGARLQASSMNFGSRLYSLNRQFLLGVKIEDAVQTALEDLANGRKPVFAVENTGESLLRQVLSRRLGLDHLEAELAELDEKSGALTDEEQARRDELAAKVNDTLRNASLDSPPQYRELLEIMLDRIGVIKVQGRYGEVSREAPDSEEYLEAAESLRKQIQAFPDLPLTPIDIIKKELAQRGFPVAEVSGRTASMAPQEGDASRWDVQFHPKSDAVANVAGFQNGRYEAIVITRSGSTGISLHATDRFEDSDIRQRDFIVVQKAANIAEFLQWMGRVNRKGQVVAPRVTSLESGLPAELRVTMMHNAKLRKLSANTTSNRQNANLEGEEFDLLNDVGDRVALEWLLENPDVAHSLDIDLPTEDDEDDTRRFSQDCPYINKLMGRLMMVSVSRQEEILRAITLRFADKLDELTQRGINPFKIDVFDWGARVEREEELQSGVIRTTGSTFDEPIKLVTLKYEQEVTPIRSDRLKKMVAVGTDLYVDAVGADGAGVKTLREQLLAARDGWVRKQLPGKLREREDALSVILEEKDAASAKGAFERATWLIDNLDSLRPGVPVVHEDTFQGERTGIIVSVDFPRTRDELFLLSKYRAKVAFPGEDKVREITLATVRNQDQDLRRSAWQRLTPDASAMPAHVRQKVEALLKSYDSVPDGVVTRTQYVLRGNIFRACELANEQRMGSPVLFTDAEGNRQRAVLLKDRITPDMVKALPIGLDASDLCDYVDEYLDPANPKYNERSSFGEFKFFDSGVKDMKKGDGLMFEGLNGARGFRFTIPGTKSRAGSLMSDGDIFDLGEKSSPVGMRLKLAGTRNYMQVDVTREQLPRLLSLLQKHRHVGKFYLPTPDHQVLGVLKARYEQGKEVERSEEVDVSP